MTGKSNPDRSLPWHDDEVIQLGDHKLVYTTDDNKKISVIKIPGRGDLTVEALISDTREAIKFPKRVRVNREYSNWRTW